MIKSLINIFRLILSCLVGVIGILGLRYFVILIKTNIYSFNSLFKILIWTVLIIIAIAIWCDYYLRTHK